MDQRSTGDEESNLVGGGTDGAESFPSTLLMVHNCTVTKVGPRHILTAAHCVYDEQLDDLRAGFRAGDVVALTEQRALGPGGPDDADVRMAHIDRTVLHPEWVKDADPEVVAVISPPHVPDVAVIILDGESVEVLADIPEAAVDLRPVADGDEVWIMGYGCESGIQGADPYPSGNRRLKVHRTVAQGWSVLDHPGTWLSPEWQQPLHAAYVITPGQAQDPAEASVCPGDSGGPVYRADGAHQHVVGVNAYYSFLPAAEDPDRISYTNWHTRLDQASRWQIGLWLSDLGVRVVSADGQPG